ncbi:hypothetical protein P775_01345 [Puniceibacterium antarcticum]|uniref:TRAP C4-dicarboxylate transport system permease DctM subunit domain-containing protein n=1 Tax=Puniceibacterium antarcticum TaxID=1206336 RepID=A0A2G8RK75_9RHOB|nr:hypothetical protein P775_01345 [Puniceibacterium antarcticum]
MGAVGIVGGVYLNGWFSLGFVLGSQPFVTSSSYSLSVIPLFMMMGAFASRAGLSASIYQALNADRPLARWARFGHGRRLRAVRRGLRIVAGYCRYHGTRRHARDDGHRL